jgi:hypothetical protein
MVITIVPAHASGSTRPVQLPELRGLAADLGLNGLPGSVLAEDTAASSLTWGRLAIGSTPLVGVRSIHLRDEAALDAQLSGRLVKVWA